MLEVQQTASSLLGCFRNYLDSKQARLLSWPRAPGRLAKTDKLKPRGGERPKARLSIKRATAREERDQKKRLRTTRSARKCFLTEANHMQHLRVQREKCTHRERTKFTDRVSNT